MSKPIPTLGAVLIVVLMAVWVGSGVMPVAGAKKPSPPGGPSHRPDKPRRS